MMQHLVDQEEMGEIGDRQRKLPRMARHCKWDGCYFFLFLPLQVHKNARVF